MEEWEFTENGKENQMLWENQVEFQIFRQGKSIALADSIHFLAVQHPSSDGAAVFKNILQYLFPILTTIST